LQGYFYAKPMPAGDLEAYLRSNRAQVFGSVVNKLAG
jgi:EAL domain-containing protein (putative c-di-GMP-specific phosphodiesterase class I)